MSKKTVIQAPGLERCPSKAQTIDRANRLLGDYDIAEPLPSPPPGVFDRAMDRANAHQLAQEEADIQPDTGSIASPRFTTGLSGIGIHIDPGAPPGSVSPPLSLKEFTAATDAIKPYWNPGKDGYVARKFITSEPAPSLSPSELTALRGLLVYWSQLRDYLSTNPVPAPTPIDLISLDRAAERIGASKQVLYRLIRHGKVKRYGRPKWYRVSWSELMPFAPSIKRKNWTPNFPPFKGAASAKRKPLPLHPPQ